MPTATSFKALGKGNGFPFCLQTIDVLDRGDGNEYDHWVTLGGFKKTDSGSPTQSQIDTSLQNAMKLFWNAHKINGLARWNSSYYYVPSVTNSRNPNTTQLQPFERICLSSDFNDYNEENGETLDGINKIQLKIIPVLLKSGNIFLGYGVRNVIESLSESFGGDFATVQIGSIQSAEYDDNYNENNDYDYITFHNINFACRASCTLNSNINTTADASNLIASDGYHYARIDSLDFYTY